MRNTYYCVFILQYCVVLLGYGVEGISMESIGYDRQDLGQVNDRLSGRSSLWSIKDHRNENYFGINRRQMRTNSKENQLKTQPSSGTIHVNDTDPLDIDEARLNIIVDKGVRSISYRKSNFHGFVDRW